MTGAANHADQAGSQDFGFEVGGGTALRNRDIGRIAQAVYARESGGLERMPVRGQPSLAVPKPGCLNNLRPAMGRNHDQQVVVDLRSFHGRHSPG